MIGFFLLPWSIYFLIASTGSSRAACQAGINPESTPITMANNNGNNDIAGRQINFILEMLQWPVSIHQTQSANQ